ncbi:MAG: glycosyltransferase family 9 protein [Bacteroidota bacterium]
MAGWIKARFPECKIYFLGRTYTRDIVALSSHVDEFINFDLLESLSQKEKIQKIKSFNADIFVHVFPRKQLARLAKSACVPIRVGTFSRPYHWLNCNTLVKLSRKNSLFHEAQLNIKLLGFLNEDTRVSAEEIPAYYGFTRVPQLASEFRNLIAPGKFNLVLHPKSKGSAKEWGIPNFKKLVALLPADQFKIFISGTAEEGKLMPELLNDPRITDLTGKLTLQQLVAFINHCDGLVAASTGPLHVAAALGKKALGLFVPRRPIHPGRWRPLGPRARAVVFDDNCQACASGIECSCITKINPEQIKNLLENETI